MVVGATAGGRGTRIAGRIAAIHRQIDILAIPRAVQNHFRNRVGAVGKVQGRSVQTSRLRLSQIRIGIGIEQIVQAGCTQG